jgi:spermidine/putrescine transport system permease protein
MKPRNRLLTIYAAVVYVFLFAPIVVLIIFSFNDSKRSVNWRGFTLDWYPALFADHALVDALSVTLRLAVVVVIVSTVVGTLLGLALARVRFRGRAATETLLLLPMVTPEIIMGLSLLVFFSAALDWHGSFTQLVFAQVTFCISYVAIVVRARAAGMNAQLEEAARDLGASAFGAFRYVTLPLIFPAILSGALLAFALSFDDYVVTTFNAGVGSSTLPLYIYGRVKFGVTPEINAISTIIVAVTAVAVLIAWYATQRRGTPRVVEEPEPGDLGGTPEPGTGTPAAKARARA